MEGYCAIVFGIFLSWWGVHNILNTKYNILDLFFSGEASGMGQLLSGIITIIIGIIVLNNK